MDISKCSNQICTRRNNCRRVTGPDGYWQSYMEFELNADGTCDHFMDDSDWTKPVVKKVSRKRMVNMEGYVPPFKKKKSNYLS